MSDGDVLLLGACRKAKAQAGVEHLPLNASSGRDMPGAGDVVWRAEVDRTETKERFNASLPRWGGSSRARVVIGYRVGH
jgi:hypothetical protein